jgi:hypothetical protein
MICTVPHGFKHQEKQQDKQQVKEFPVIEILDLVNRKFPKQPLIIIDSFLNRLEEIWKNN